MAGPHWRGWAQYLVGQGETVYDVNPRWTAQGRRQARRPGKTARLDARAVALVVWREAATLPALSAEDETTVLALLVTEREGALAEATRGRNQLQALLLQLDPQYKTRLPPQYKTRLPPLDTEAGLHAAQTYTLAPSASLVQQARAAAVRRLAQRVRLATSQAQDLKAQSAARAPAHFSPLTPLKGSGPLLAGALAGVLGPGPRFTTDGQLAAYGGVAPLEASSAEHVRHRLNRGGNRRLNALLHQIARTQARCWAPAHAYLARRLREGQTKRAAFRALKRDIARAVFRLWQECLAVPAPAPAATAA